MIKKRYVILVSVLLMIILGSFVQYTKPVLPVIQLPGEIYPGTKGMFGDTAFSPPGITNTFVASIVAWIIVVAIGLSLRARSRSADEVPSGFYNLFEALIEGLFNFSANIAGQKKAKEFFPLFFTIIIYVLIANWMELVPGVDSIGIWEYLPHFEALKEADELEQEAEAEGRVAFATEEEREEFIHERELELAEELDTDDPNVGYMDGLFLVRPPGEEGFTITEYQEDHVGWSIVPFTRAATTDLNLTLALALVTMVMVQYYGFKYLGTGYLKKFFPIDIQGMTKNPIKVIDPAVGILELIGEISRVISFAFRLLGNIFAGQILLFVMAFLLPVANVAFFGLEFFVGIIQAMVFGLLAVIFMSGATESHGDHGHDDEDVHPPVDAEAATPTD
ncbi:MAG: F0F1 ATP synthase subunit A [Candidatus Promineifilaceae bacterium]|nr:F0F1 ATP synthase subunit A [Candidatus Promineifilaceae bacterium]